MSDKLLTNLPVYNRYIELLLAKEKNFLKVISEEFSIPIPGVRRILESTNNAAYFKPYLDSLVEASSLDKVQLIQELRSIAFSDLSNYVTVEGDNLVFKNWADIPKEYLAAVQEIKKTELKDGTVSFSIKLWNKLDALTILSKVAGIHQENVKIDQDITVKHRLFDDVFIEAKLDDQASSAPPVITYSIEDKY